MKKYSSGSFIDAAVRVYGSEADTISSFPATIYADGENASALIKGNLQQSGTPTAAAPITPTECGDFVSSNYTIPIISGGVTTSINLAEVQTTRNIKKYEFTGQESLTFYTGSPSGIGAYFRFTDMMSNAREKGVCSHFNPISVPAQATSDSVTFGVANNIVYFMFATATATALNLTDIQSITQWFADQYTNGTPVTIWYVLAAESVGILNEPLRKIGDNVDSVSATVPTLATAESITVDTTLKPSALQLTYTGCHDHSDKKRSGGAWT